MIISSSAQGQWQAHNIEQLFCEATVKQLPAQRQIVTESWNRVVRHPTLCYMQERDRLLIVVNRDHPEEATLIFSDDHGATWTEPRWAHTDAKGEPDVGFGLAVSYLDGGNLILGSASRRWFSSDYGGTWGDPIAILPASNGSPWHQWHPYLVDRDPETGEVIRLAETGYNSGVGSWPDSSQGFIRFSTDEGKTWSDDIKVPQWHGIGEVGLVRAANGDIVAGCRSGVPHWCEIEIDHYEGLGVSISKDDGKTWSEVKALYDYGRHHACMVVIPTGEIVMTYVVRRGYPSDVEGFPQFGIEAMVSRDNGQSWDTHHRLVLYRYSGTMKAIDPDPSCIESSMWSSSTPNAPQSTSTVLLPDGSLLTAFGLGYRNAEPFPPVIKKLYDIGLVKWQLPGSEG